MVVTTTELTPPEKSLLPSNSVTFSATLDLITTFPHRGKANGPAQSQRPIREIRPLVAPDPSPALDGDGDDPQGRPLEKLQGRPGRPRPRIPLQSRPQAALAGDCPP